MGATDIVLDPAHANYDLFGQEITKDIWKDKYRWLDEPHPFDSFQRVNKGVFPNELEWAQESLLLMRRGLWLPGGRIQSSAGTTKKTTWINCFCSQTIEDSMDSIGDALKSSMFTMQMGGGIGMDFSTLRPFGAILKRTGSIASGPLPFMDMWDSMCSTIMSAGSRRGAMMGALADWHPDIHKFIEAKHVQGRLENFNVSVLVSDAFMAAVEEDADWHLGFPEPPKDGAITVEEINGVPWYVYEVLPARQLWEEILKSTYEYSEPGIIFIDRINDLNNLNYCETIRACNPCGEQPLPPWGDCDLGHVNLTRLIMNPFSEDAYIDEGNLIRTVHLGVRFLDSVLDHTPFPLEEQRGEALSKRRIGLGFTGLANALAMMRIPYSSEDATIFAEKVLRLMANEAYRKSAELAGEKGPFPLYDSCILAAPFICGLDSDVQELIKKNGLRNGVLLTLAPVGTGSLYYGNVSSGLEPIFELEYERKVLQSDNTFKTYTVIDYGFGLYKAITGKDKAPHYMQTARDLTVRQHIAMQAACQKWIDASISKTINCAEDMDWDEFQQVYQLAYDSGCKGCTTYRPSEMRGSILHAKGDKPNNDDLPNRPDVLLGTTYKIRWPSHNSSLYVTINDMDDRPYEIFVSSASSRDVEWITALTLMISALMRRGEDISFIPRELKKIVSPQDIAWINGTFFGSLPAKLGAVLEHHLGIQSEDKRNSGFSDECAPLAGRDVASLDFCPNCGSKTYRRKEGCGECLSCTYSDCG